MMLQTSIDLNRLLKEIELAKQIQNNLLPKQLPVLSGLDIWAVTSPAYQIGGDFYDFIWDRNQTLNLVIADVSGKGVSGALLMPMTRMAIRNQVSREYGLSPEEIIDQSNRDLYDDFTNTRTFATAFVGNYDPSTHLFIYANAGHSPVIYYPVGGFAQYLEADGYPIGTLTTTSSANHFVQFKAGDVLIIGTDGILENFSQPEGLEEACLQLLIETEKLVTLPARSIAEGLLTQSNTLQKSITPIDDQTLVVLKCM
jgi:phosphoserine phosphatase RsbU/P